MVLSYFLKMELDFPRNYGAITLVNRCLLSDVCMDWCRSTEQMRCLQVAGQGLMWSGSRETITLLVDAMAADSPARMATRGGVTTSRKRPGSLPAMQEGGSTPAVPARWRTSYWSAFLDLHRLRNAHTCDTPFNYAPVLLRQWD